MKNGLMKNEECIISLKVRYKPAQYNLNDTRVCSRANACGLRVPHARYNTRLQCYYYNLTAIIHELYVSTPLLKVICAC